MTYTVTVTQRGRTHETYARTRPEADEAYGRLLAANPSAEVIPIRGRQSHHADD